MRPAGERSVVSAALAFGGAMALEAVAFARHHMLIFRQRGRNPIQEEVADGATERARSCRRYRGEIRCCAGELAANEAQDLPRFSTIPPLFLIAISSSIGCWSNAIPCPRSFGCWRIYASRPMRQSPDSCRPPISPCTSPSRRPWLILGPLCPFRDTGLAALRERLFLETVSWFFLGRHRLTLHRTVRVNVEQVGLPGSKGGLEGRANFRRSVTLLPSTPNPLAISTKPTAGSVRSMCGCGRSPPNPKSRR